MEAYRRAGVWAYGRARGAPLPNGTYRTHGTYGSSRDRPISPISRIGPIRRRTSRVAPRRHAHAAIRSQDLPTSVLRDILVNRGSFNRTVEQNP